MNYSHFCSIDGCYLYRHGWFPIFQVLLSAIFGLVWYRNRNRIVLHLSVEYYCITGIDDDHTAKETTFGEVWEERDWPSVFMDWIACKRPTKSDSRYNIDIGSNVPRIPAIRGRIRY